MKKAIFFIAVLFCVYNIAPLEAREILQVKEYPTTGDATQDAALRLALDSAVSRVNDGPFGQLGKNYDLARGFADAGIITAKTGNHYAYQSYENFALLMGVAVSAQVPDIWDELFQILKNGKYKSLKEDILNEGDPYFGVGLGAVHMNVGYHLKSLLKGLHVSIKYGNIDQSLYNVSYETTIFGLGFDYSILRTERMFRGLFMWRGLSFGSGLLYNAVKINFLVDNYDRITETSGPAEISIKPKVDLGIETKSYTIPFTVVSSIQVLWVLNFFGGVGMDLNFGKANVLIHSESDIEASYNGIDIPAEQRGKLTTSGDTEGTAPSLFRFYMMYGMGFNLGPVKFEYQYSYYVSGGYSYSFHCGAVW